MILCKCDRCKCDIETPQILCKDVKYPSCFISVMYNEKDKVRSIDLCDACREEFIKWLNGSDSLMKATYDIAAEGDCQYAN